MIEIVQTSKAAGYWCRRFIPKFSPKTRIKRANIALFPEKRFQKILGFGGAFTEAACSNIMKSSPQTMETIMRAYFTSSGLNYCLGRVVINSCDFSLDTYSYVAEGDTNLSTFNLAREEKYVIPVIEIAKSISEYPMRFLASPWSPPAYMKTNSSMTEGGTLKPECYSLWAQYITRYLQEMSKRHIYVEFLSVQNEPEAT
ncbi:MAG TPA: glucosylceramidase, partial [Bacilli bacterium]|nr:glucosylceramidase [Bacilli bacterium]